MQENTIKGELVGKLRRLHRQTTGEDFPADFTDDEIILSALVQLIEDYYL